MKTGAELLLDHYKGKYQKGTLTEEQLSQMVIAGTISENEKQYIMEGEEPGDSRLKELEDFHTTVMAKVRGE